MQISRHNYMNASSPESQVSPFDRASNLANAEFETSDVVAAYTSETFEGEASLQQDLSARGIARAEKGGTPISEEDWKVSEYNRQGITYYPTMTKESAEILAEIADARESRQFIMSKASGGQTALGMTTGFVTGIVEPKNLAAGVAAALATAGIGGLFPTIGRMIATTTVRGAAARGVAEGVVAAGIMEPSNIESSKIVQGDYTMADSLVNFTLSSILGAGIGAGAKAVELKGRSKQLNKLRAYRAARDEEAVKEFDTALTQTIQGKKVDVEAVTQIESAQTKARAEKELLRIEQKIATQQERTGVTKVTDRPEFKKWFEGSKVVDDTGAPMVVYHGTNADIEQFDIRKFGETDEGFAGKGFYFVNDPKIASEYTEKRVKGQPNIIPVYADLKNPLEVNSYEDLSNVLGLSTERDRSGQMSEKINNEAKSRGYDGIIIKDDGVNEYVVFNPEQIKSIFNRGAFDPNDPRLIDINEAEDLQIKKGQAQVDAAKQIDDTPVKRLMESQARPDNSTAYTADDVKIADKNIDEWQQADLDSEIERSLEMELDQIAELREQGVLNNEEIRIMERLDEIDAENDMFDSVLSSAKICLTRG